MARKIETLLVCDVYGCGVAADEVDVETVEFAVANKGYAVELCAAHRSDFDACTGWVIEAARTTTGRHRSPRRPSGTQTGEVGNPSAVREWAVGNGWPKLATRGRIPAEVRAAYVAAQ